MSNHFARNLRFYREAAGLSTAKLAKRVGWSQATIHDFEESHTIPSELFQRVLAAVLGIAVAELTRDELPPPKPMKVTDPTERKPGLESREPLP